jgi:hypothetical protein
MFAVDQALNVYTALKDQFVTAFTTGAQ